MKYFIFASMCISSAIFSLDESNNHLYFENFLGEETDPNLLYDRVSLIETCLEIIEKEFIYLPMDDDSRLIIQMEIGQIRSLIG